jgi:hypothetical protein
LQSFNDGQNSWVKAHRIAPLTELVAKAVAAIDRIIGAHSELPEIWEGDTECSAAVQDLRSRVAG